MMITKDKIEHAFVSYAILLSVYVFINCLEIAIITTLTIGVGKEIIDGKNNTMKEHLYDLLADIVGIVLAIGLIILGY